jgi:hypothetical protein
MLDPTARGIQSAVRGKKPQQNTPHFSFISPVVEWLTALTRWSKRGKEKSMVSLRLGAGLLLTLSSAALSQTVQVCGWMVESVKPENVYQFDVWLQTDGELSFLYKMSGAGVVAGSNKTHSPGSGTYVLHAGKAEKPWGFGTTLYPPAKIDITIELHEMAADIFSEAPTPLLAKFDFRRDVPESETKPPATLARKQCLAVKTPAKN